MKRFAAIVVLSLALACFGAAPKTVPLDVIGDTVTVVRSLPVTVKAKEGSDFYLWNHSDSVKSYSTDNVLTITAAPKGSHKITVISVTIDFVIDDKGKVKKTVVKDKGEVEVVIGDVPSPTPGPNPDPGPAPAPSPIAGDGFRVLMVFDSAQKSKMTEAQLDVLEGKKVYDYLRSKCIVDANNPNGAFRIWPSDVNTAGTSKPWQDAMKRDRKSLPWIIISTGRTGYEGPLPANEDDALAILKKYAEPPQKGGK